MTDPTPYDTGEVCEPKPWLDNDPLNIGSPHWGRVDFDDDEGSTVISQLRVEPAGRGHSRATITFASGVDEIILHDLNRGRIRVVDHLEGVNSLEAKIAQAGRALDQGSDAGDDDVTRLADTIANLYHWCDANGVDFTEAADRAEGYKAAELADWEGRSDG